MLALLLATTHLHYTQNMMENNYIFLLTLTGFSYQYEWLRTGSRRALLTVPALGLNLLTRLTTGMDLIAAGGFFFCCAELRACGSKNALGTILRLYCDSDAGLSWFFVLAGSPVSVLSLRILLQYLHHRCDDRDEAPRSIASCELSV